jgi:hypothetical protein
MAAGRARQSLEPGRGPGRALAGEVRRRLPVHGGRLDVDRWPVDPLPELQSLAAWSKWLPLNAAVALAPQDPGVYLARQAQGPVIYVGMAGERRGQGLRGRLKIYTSGKGLASGLGEAVFDRALAEPTWLRARLAEVDAGEPRRAKEWGKAAIEWADVQVCRTTTPDRASALELTVLRTLHADPLWNRHR